MTTTYTIGYLIGQPVVPPGLITDDGTVTDPSTQEFLRTFMAEFGRFIVRVHLALPKTT